MSIKYIFTLCTFVCVFTQAKAQKPDAESFTATVNEGKLNITWKTTPGEVSNYYEVQGSEDGKTFTAIGYVLGHDPKESNHYKFKQQVSKLKKGLVFFRVLHIQNDNTATAGNTVRLSK